MTELTVRPPAHHPAPTVDMSTTLAGTTFPNPVFTASGCAAAGQELDQFFDVTALGGVVTKSIMLAPRSGRATPRMAETPSGMLNSIGLQGPGIEAFLDKDLAWLADRGARAVVEVPVCQAFVPASLQGPELCYLHRNLVRRRIHCRRQNSRRSVHIAPTSAQD